MNDLVFEDHGTVFFIWPLTPQAADWLHATPLEDAIFFNGALAVERRCIGDVVFAVYRVGFKWSTHHWPERAAEAGTVVATVRPCT